MKIRYVWVAPIAAALVAGLVSCGGGGGSTPAPTYTVGGTISGSAGVTLRLNGAGDLSVPALGTFTFPGGLTNGSAYTVTVTGNAQPCNVANGAGTMGATNITNVVVTCTTVVRTALLNGASENPPNSSAATGRGAVVVNPTTLEITGGITFTGVVPTAGGHHIHQAPSGNATGNGGVVIGLTLAPDGSTATVPAGSVLTAPQYAALLAGELYFNVHSANNLCPPAPNCAAGEIRGQINITGGVTAGLAALNGASEVPTNSSTATGRGTLVFDSTTRQVVIAYATHNVANATAAHVHTGAPGVSGPANVVNPMTVGTNIYTAVNPTILTVQNVTDINAGNTYFNVHSSNNLCPPAATCAAGEIRGQVAIQ